MTEKETIKEIEQNLIDDFSLLAAVQTVQAETLAAIAKLDDTP